MIDIHILKTRSTAEVVADTLTHPLVNIHIIPGIIGNILEGRVKGFLTGTDEYVSFVDDDDAINREDYDKFIQYVYEKKPDTVYSNCIQERTEGSMVFYKHKEWTYEYHQSVVLPIHQMTIVKRSIMEKAIIELESFPYLDAIKFLPEPFLYSYITIEHDWIFIPHLCPYIWKYIMNKGRPTDITPVLTARRAMKDILTERRSNRQ